MRYFLIAFFLVMVNMLSAQTEAKITDGGALKSQVTDIVVVFKMHVDIGYYNTRYQYTIFLPSLKQTFKKDLIT